MAPGLPQRTVQGVQASEVWRCPGPSLAAACLAPSTTTGPQLGWGLSSVLHPPSSAWLGLVLRPLSSVQLGWGWGWSSVLHPPSSAWLGLFFHLVGALPPSCPLP